MITLVDYGAGNLVSVGRALEYLYEPWVIANEPEQIIRAERLIFPGVGSAGQAMEQLEKTGMDEAIKEFHKSGKPILGICLGAQIILDYSAENKTKCLGLMEGVVYRLSGNNVKVPHMGWNSIIQYKDHPVLANIENGTDFYFLHSYFSSPMSHRVIVAGTEYGFLFASIIAEDNIFATQFHPEKSGSEGLQLLRNFCEWSV